MTRQHFHLALNALIASVWIGFGLFGKILGFAPRHNLIVARILGDAYAGPITVAIGILEVLMAAWVLSGIRSRFNAITQIVLVLTMNLLETTLAFDLLLWGRYNLVFAAAFAGIIYFNHWKLGDKAG